MRLAIERGQGQPVYLQIKRQLAESILNGALVPGTRLPSSRSLAHDLGVSRITVDAAYAELEADGLVALRQGSGTYVLPSLTLPARAGNSLTAWPPWQQTLLANQPPAAPTPTDLLRQAGHPDSIDLAVGGGDPGGFPVEEFRKVVQQVLRQQGASAALDYGDPRGLPALRATISAVLASQGIAAHPEQVLITSGSQQAIALTVQQLLRPGDSVVVEAPSYGRALDLFRQYGLRLISVPVDRDGMLVERLEQLLRGQQPKLIYTIPNFQNPTGACLSGHRRRQLLALADRHDLPVLEDDFVGDLRYDGAVQPALKALDPGGRVIHVSTFSKMLLPGLRVGFLLAEGPVYDALVRCKYLHDLASSQLLQHALQAYITVGRYQAHLRRSVHSYRQRRDAMLQAIRQWLPAEVGIDPPAGGLFLWLRLPTGVSADRLLPIACAQGVAFTPGSGCFAQPLAGESYLRLNFAAQSVADGVEGIRRLGVALRRSV